MRLTVTRTIGVTNLIFLAACSSSSPDKTPVSERQASPNDSPTIAMDLRYDDQSKIDSTIAEFKKRDWAEHVNRTFNIKIYDGLIDGKQRAKVHTELDKRKTSSEYVLSGTIQEVAVGSMSIASDTAEVTACERHDQQVWESNRTPEKSDDILIDGSLKVSHITYELVMRGSTWIITNSAPSEGDCSQSF
jgi:hypothetical protein